ncbi:Hypothetical predicted protein [Pelobates cultripes]|uniref:Coiled-coil domain-containing protein 160 n=1 Tax=Pelobates cultripes TaxID=61616 RepID=A0AAD1T4Z2_PELCU|nr:Hypothetical predicted protein [Pelobates cultripes]
MEAEKKHWVEELFSPHFSAEDFLYHSFEPDQLESEKLSDKRAKAVETIYHTALYNTQQAEKEKRKAFLSKMIVRDYVSLPEQINTKQSNTDQCQTCCLCGKVNTFSAANNEDNCIWDENELNILRDEIKKTQTEQSYLKVHLDACKRETSELKSRNCKTVQELEEARASLSASQRKNECKKVLIKQMQKDLLKKDAMIQALRKDMHEKCVEVSSLNKHLAKAKQDILGLQLKNEDFEKQLKTLKKQQEFKSVALVDKLKLEHNLQLNKLHREIKAVKEEITSEKLQHDRDIVALDSLRKHFSSLSVNSSPNFAHLNVTPH